MSSPYDIRYAEKAAEDLRGLRRTDQRKILETIDRHLRHEPKLVSRSRIKWMRQPFWSQYRLRIEDHRVYYDVDDARNIVNILRILEKGAEQTPQESP